MGVFVFYVTDKSNEVVTKVCCLFVMPYQVRCYVVSPLRHVYQGCYSDIGRCMIICLNVTACVV